MHAHDVDCGSAGVQTANTTFVLYTLPPSYIIGLSIRTHTAELNENYYYFFYECHIPNNVYTFLQAKKLNHDFVRRI